MRSRVTVRLVINMQKPLCEIPSGYQYCAVNLRLLGVKTFFLFIQTDQYLPAFLHEFHIFFSLHNFTCRNTAMHMKSHHSRCSIHQKTLIRPWNDIHTFYTTRLRILKLQERKKKKEKKSLLRLLRSDMTVMQTTALKINGIPKPHWVIMSVISIDQRLGYVKFPFYW